MADRPNTSGRKTARDEDEGRIDQGQGRQGFIHPGSPFGSVIHQVVVGAIDEHLDIQNIENISPLGGSLIAHPHEGRTNPETFPDPSGRYEIFDIECALSPTNIFGLKDHGIPLPHIVRHLFPVHRVPWEDNDIDDWLPHLQKTLVAIIGIVRLFFLAKYRETTGELKKFIISSLAGVIRAIDDFNLDVSSNQALSHQITTYDAVRRVAILAASGIRPGSFKDNYNVRLNSPNPFQPLPHEDNPFLLFCREFYCPLLVPDYDSWVQLCKHKYDEIIEAASDSIDFASLRAETYKRRCITIAPDHPDRSEVYHFPYGFNIAAYGGNYPPGELPTALDPAQSQDPPYATRHFEALSPYYKNE